MARKPDKNKKNPKVNPQLEGFDVRIDTFGEIKSNLGIDKINEFLNRNVDDKKLRDRDDIEGSKEEKLNKKRKSTDSSEEDEEDNT